MGKYGTTLYGDDGETLKVEFNFHPGTPDVYYLPNGDPGYPGDPPELEILEVRNEAGQVIELSEELEELYTLQIFENLNDHLPDEPDPDYLRDREQDHD